VIMDKKTLQAQLVSMRHQAMSFAASIEAALSLLEGETECPHTNRLDMSTFEREEWECEDCGFHYREGDDD